MVTCFFSFLSSLLFSSLLIIILYVLHCHRCAFQLIGLSDHLMFHLQLLCPSRSMNFLFTVSWCSLTDVLVLSCPVVCMALQTICYRVDISWCQSKLSFQWNFNLMFFYIIFVLLVYFFTYFYLIFFLWWNSLKRKGRSSCWNWSRN